MKTWLKICIIGLLSLFLCYISFYNLNYKTLSMKPIFSNQYDVSIGKQYTVKRINVIDSSSFGVLIPEGLYYVKLDVRVVDSAKKDIINLFNDSNKLMIKILKIDGNNIFVEIVVYKDKSTFKLTSWLKEKGLVFKN